MSSLDRLKRASIFKKMALRDKLEALRKRQSLGVLRKNYLKMRMLAINLKSLLTNQK